MAKVMNLFADDTQTLCQVANALSSSARIDILKLLYYNSYSVKEIANKLSIPTSSAALHVRILEEANLIQTKHIPGYRGSMKVCSRKNDFINIQLSGNNPKVKKVSTISMPIGAFTNCSIFPSCGIASEEKQIGYEDRPSDFYHPHRMDAQILWSSAGYVEYKFPFPVNYDVAPKCLIISLELCSEAPNFKENWKSDITFWVNGKECGTWRSPGDFGERRGKLNPEWWDNGLTQYGKLISIEVSSNGTLINSQEASEISISDLNLTHSEPISLRIGNKEDAEYIGGFNIFGSKFGDYGQDILLSFVY